jgi:hypothetical protein
MWNLDIPIIQTFKYTLQRFKHEFLFHFTFLKTIVACFVGPIELILKGKMVWTPILPRTHPNFPKTFNLDLVDFFEKIVQHYITIAL